MIGIEVEVFRIGITIFLTIFISVFFAEAGGKRTAIIMLASDKQVIRATIFMAASAALVIASGIGALTLFTEPECDYSFFLNSLTFLVIWLLFSELVE